jgi:hypothetical protein
MLDDFTTVLRERWPLAFAAPPRPLKVGIFDDLRSLLSEVQDVLISRALCCWTMQSGYLAACVPGAARFDLHGQAVGAVTDSQAGYAASALHYLRCVDEQEPGTGQPHSLLRFSVSFFPSHTGWIVKWRNADGEKFDELLPTAGEARAFAARVYAQVCMTAREGSRS